MKRLGPSVVVVGAVLGSHRMVAQESHTPPPSSFVLVRYASVSSLWIYAGVGIGPTLAVVGLVQNPRSEYREAVAGIGVRLLPERGNNAMVALAGVNASDGWYTRLYLLPTLTLGRGSASGAIVLSQPCNAAGVRQLDLHAVALTQPIMKALRVGGASVIAAADGAATSVAAGPVGEVATRKGSIRVELLKGLRREPDEVEVRFRVAF